MKQYKSIGKSITRLVAVLVASGGMVVATAGIAHAAPGGVPGAPAWSHKGGQPGCGAALITIPTESPAYYAAHPDEFASEPGMPATMREELAQIALNQPTVLQSMSCAPGQMRKPTNLTAANISSLNWAGYWTQTGTPTKTFASLTWTVPTVTGTSSNSDLVIWPGLGSGNSAADELVQAGTDQANASTTFWYEMYPYQPMQKITSIAVSPGNSVQVLIYFNTSTRTATYDFYNNTKNTFTAVTEVLPSGHTYLGTQAEWIVERTTLANGSLAVLPNFGIASLSKAGWDTSGSSSSNVMNSSYSSITMINSSGQTMATPGTASSTGNFNVTWNRAS